MLALFIRLDEPGLSWIYIGAENKPRQLGGQTHARKKLNPT